MEAAAAARKATEDIAEAEARATIAKASAAAKVRGAWYFRAAIGVGIMLLLDFIWHETEDAIKWNMARKLRACELPQTSLAEEQRLEMRRSPLGLPFLVNVLYGPTGCGKSTLLKDTARAFLLRGVPTFLIGVRMPKSDDSLKSPLDASQAVQLMDASARQVYSQVGFPARRSIVVTVMEFVASVMKSLSFTLKMGTFEAGTAIELPASSSRLMTCFEYLFAVCETVYKERRALGMSAEEAAPVLLFDELEDLIKDSRLKNAGGKPVLDYLSVMLVKFSVDDALVRVCITGSSAKIALALASPARGNRLYFELLADPTRDTMLTALKGRGYTMEEAAAMVDLCGTRLRWFVGPLRSATPPTAANFISNAIKVATCDFGTVKKGLAAADRAQFATMLDGVEASYSGGEDMREDNDITMPPSSKLIDLAPILFVDVSRALTFQSNLHRKVWQTERKCHEWRSK